MSGVLETKYRDFKFLVIVDVDVDASRRLRHPEGNKDENLQLDRKKKCSIKDKKKFLSKQNLDKCVRTK